MITGATSGIGLSTVRHAASKVLYNLINSIVSLNNTYIKRGIKRYLEELVTFKYIPNDFEKLYMAIINAKTIEEIRNASYEMLKTIVELYDKMYDEFVIRPVPSYDNLDGTYEELWCNCLNKVIISTESNDKSYVYHVARGAQEYLDEMTECIGTKKFDLMQYFDPDNLLLFKEVFLRVMEEYLEEYNKVGRKVKRYDSFEQLYDNYMQA